MKKPKTLFAMGKTHDKAMKQARNWFKRNPNRRVVNVKMEYNSEKLFLVKREQVLPETT